VSAGEPAVAVDGLRIVLRDTDIDIVDEVSFTIAPGEVLGLVGESGSGKTTVGLALLGHTRRGAAIAGGSIRVGDVDILSLSGSGRRSIRGRVVSYVPQDPAASLNPALRIGTQLRETLDVHGFGSGSEERNARIAEVMREVALPDDAKYLRRYPHELSGGQQQRIGLAMAFACRPRLIVLDEPTTGLDVTTQAHVLGTVRELAAAHHVAALYVSHDLAVVGTLATRTAVMYAGRIVELGPTAELLVRPAHPYTQALRTAVPNLDMAAQANRIVVPGIPADPAHPPPGCPFHPRCPLAVDVCRVEEPRLRSLALGHTVACHRAEEALAGFERARAAEA
jgi:peptide/nickel transport system ATP-binding protein